MPDLEVAFCAQSPWLRNTSIRENIVGISEYDQAWYSRVVSCCSLDEDFAQFTERDDTMVGSKGVALSGGQKNRLVHYVLDLIDKFTNCFLVTGPCPLRSEVNSTA